MQKLELFISNRFRRKKNYSVDSKKDFHHLEFLTLFIQMIKIKEVDCEKNDEQLEAGPL